LPVTMMLLVAIALDGWNEEPRSVELTLTGLFVSECLRPGAVRIGDKSYRAYIRYIVLRVVKTRRGRLIY
jgi:hypothetical protein